MKKKYFITIILIIFVMISVFAEGSAEISEKENEKILVYLSGPEEMLKALETNFEADRGDVADFLIMSCGQVRSKVWTEKEAGQIQPDVIWGSDPLLYNRLEKEDLLEDLSNIENVKDLKKEFLTSHNYLLSNQRYVTIMYNPQAFDIDERPNSYNDLLRSKYSGQIVMADATQSSTALGITSSLFQIYGQDFFEKLKENNLMLTKANGQVPSLIIEGQYDLGIAPHDAVIRLQQKAKKGGYEINLENIWPEDGVIAINRPIALIKKESRSLEQENISKELVNYLISKPAQLITNKFGFVSVRKDISNKFLPEGIKIVSLDWEMASETEETLKGIYEKIFQK